MDTDFLQIAEERYSTKKYSDKKIPAEHIEKLKEILRLTPSSINSQPWQFYFVGDEGVKSQLAENSFFNEAKIKEASHLVVFCAEASAEEFERRIAQDLPEGAVKYYRDFVKQKGEDAVLGWLTQQVYISLGFFLAACASMGIDCTPMEGVDKEKYTEILGLENYRCVLAVAIGYRHEDDANQPKVKPKTRREASAVIKTV